MSVRRNIMRWLGILAVLAMCAGIPLSWVVVPLMTYGLNQNLVNSIAPDLQSVAEKPVRCKAGYIGISVTTSEADYEAVCAKVQEMIEGGKIGCSVRVETDNGTKYVDLQRR
jgi:hypothetical protein